jgi:hypothetical protein
MAEPGRIIDRQMLDEGLCQLALVAAEFMRRIEDFGKYNDRTTQEMLEDASGPYAYTTDQAYAIKATLQRWAEIRVMAGGGAVPSDFPHDLMTDTAAYGGLGTAG